MPRTGYDYRAGEVIADAAYGRTEQVKAPSTKRFTRPRGVTYVTARRDLTIRKGKAQFRYLNLTSISTDGT